MGMVGEVRQKEISIERLRVDLGKQSVCDGLGCWVRLLELRLGWLYGLKCEDCWCEHEK